MSAKSASSSPAGDSPPSPKRQRKEAVGSASALQPSSAISFLRLVGKLKELKRTGWIHHGVAGPESVSDHMYRMAMCSFLITDPAVDRDRVMKIAIVHDLAEALAGDIAPHQGVSDADKRKLEEDALDTIVQQLGVESIAAEVKALWLEYEEGRTPEAMVVKDLDKFEMILQADDYEQAQSPKHLEDFFRSTKGYFKTPQVQAWDQELRKQRDQRKASTAPEGTK